MEKLKAKRLSNIFVYIHNELNKRVFKMSTIISFLFFSLFWQYGCLNFGPPLVRQELYR
jgi:hypothetical protein